MELAQQSQPLFAEALDLFGAVQAVDNARFTHDANDWQSRMTEALAELNLVLQHARCDVAALTPRNIDSAAE